MGNTFTSKAFLKTFFQLYLKLPTQLKKKKEKKEKLFSMKCKKMIVPS